MDVRNFRTPQEIRERKNVSARTSWVIGIDAGYSGVKVICPNKCACFPSYVRKVDEGFIFPGKEDILYRDETGMYAVGRSAQKMATSDDTSDPDSEFFSRNRYNSSSFKICVRTGIAIGLLDNPIMKRPDDIPVFVQTGLPTAYLRDKDINAIKKVISTPYSFQIKIGNRGWIPVNMDIKKENINVIAQPAGTFYSILIDENGKYIPDARLVMSKNILIVDAGFGTFDPYGILNRKIYLKESLPDLGMKKVLQEAAKELNNDYMSDIRLVGMQNALEKGFVNVMVDDETLTTEEIPVAKYIEKANKAVCLESIERLKSMTNSFMDYDILVMTGGTGQAWMDIYKEALKNIKKLQVVAGNRNDNLPMFYSNARGYYMLRTSSLRAGDLS